MSPSPHAHPSAIRWGCGILYLFAALNLLLGGCGTAPQTIGAEQIQPRLLYLQGVSLMDQNRPKDASAKFQEIITRAPGSHLGIFAHYRLGEANLRQKKWTLAEQEFKTFLALHRNGPYRSDALYQLMQTQYERSYVGLFFRSRDTGRNMDANRSLVDSFRHFFLLYPQSVYREQAHTLYEQARDLLAEHEHKVADFYFERGYYNAAASRYRYLLEHYAEYQQQREVLDQLILAYRRDQQADLALELQRVRKHLFP